MHVSHLCGVIGLSLNTLGAVALLRFGGKPDANAPLSPEQMQAVRLMIPKARRSYAFEIWGYRLSIVALVIGFMLQLIDLLRS
jgi:hypothetical protein